jgi:hypothetical protein
VTTRKSTTLLVIVAFFVMIPLQIASNEPLEVLKQFFQSKGFSSGDITLPHLGVKVTLEKNQFYKIEENVSDIPSRINEIRAIFGMKGPLPKRVRSFGWAGVVDVEYKGQRGYGYTVLVKKETNKFTHVYTHAHENGHFLWYIGQQNMIYEMFNEPGYIRSRISDNDEFAELCGWLAAKRAGFNIRKCTIQNTGKKDRRTIERIKKLVWNTDK